ncbi:hypothetical protein CBW24_08025 [Pacificitalea manganoxidans]|uniref:Uncharacterized protein n=1 Tax=Pacificitalea manganoxidans TaxID=1411902 RepID=A0A291LYY5_9RHOB|nr:phage tail protein [Pacificitalea manganoxidans]ATI41956.1 hypothetical protein CBW24_08025 [Pacificitalea manganoxidans]MDR6309444.1 phage-related tail fiber protein [Pacificitalea manganoxidans]
MPDFQTLHTEAGLAAIYAASGSEQITLTHMAVGDGGGLDVIPDPSQTALVREVFRAEINRVYKPDPSGDPTRFAAELVVPATEGGFTLREVGVFDADGSLFAVGNLPATYKPTEADGAYADTVIRLEFIVSNAEVITLRVDPNVAVASQQWVVNNIVAATVIPGGTTQQVLRKVSNADGDVEWADPTDANITVSTIEERQVLAGGQTQVDLTLTNTTGLAVYIEGLRLPNEAIAEGWQPDGSLSTRLHLGQSYPAGSELIAVQNEPASALPEALRKDQNLADVPDKAAGRANLGVPSLDQMRQRTPTGAVMDFAMPTAPAGWLKCNGAEISRTVYADLFNAIGTIWGGGNGSTTFNLPDFRGEFRRGWDDGRGIDAGRSFAAAQADAFRAHTHQLVGNDADTGGQSRAVHIDDDGKEGRIDVTEPTGGNETRPRNIAVLTCIKF